MTKTFEFSLRFINFLAFLSLQIPIKAIIPGVAHSPPIIEFLLNFLSFKLATVLATLLSEIETQQLLAFLIFAKVQETFHYKTYRP